MFGWQFVCLLCFNLWRIEVWASPTSRHYTEGKVIFNPSHILDYQSVHDNTNEVLSRNATSLPAQRHDISNFSEKNESKRKGGAIKTTRIRRTPTGFSARGFHEEVFDRDFGHFSPVKRSDFEKRRPEADAAGFYGDTFSNGFGEFETMKRKYQSPSYGYKGMSRFDMEPIRYIPIPRSALEAGKRSPEMTKSGFHSDVFNGGFGEFHPMRK